MEKILYLLIPAASLIGFGLWLLLRKPHQGEYIYTESGRSHPSLRERVRKAGIK